MTDKKKYIVTGGAGFIGSHLTCALVEAGHEVCIFDNLGSGFKLKLHPLAKFVYGDITDYYEFRSAVDDFKPDGIFHMAAIARTPWCLDQPLLAASVNAQGTCHVLEAARSCKVKRVVLSSSNVVYAAHTPYRATKEMVELWGRVYNEMYDTSNIALRYSNVYGTGQSELGPSPNVFAAFRNSFRKYGRITITGDGEQSRDFTHVSDIVAGNILAMNSDYRGVLDLCTGKNWSMNEVARDMFHAPIQYIPDRPGDITHIVQDPAPAKDILGWVAKVALPDGIKDVLDCEDYLKAT